MLDGTLTERTMYHWSGSGRDEAGPRKRSYVHSFPLQAPKNISRANRPFLNRDNPYIFRDVLRKNV